MPCAVESADSRQQTVRVSELAQQERQTAAVGQSQGLSALPFCQGRDKEKWLQVSATGRLVSSVGCLAFP